MKRPKNVSARGKNSVSTQFEKYSKNASLKYAAIDREIDASGVYEGYL